MSHQALLTRMVETLERDVLPMTEVGVAAGNKIFGAAILRKDNLSLVLAETNNEQENPLWHGEMHAIKRFYELPKATRPEPKECIFLSSHEPCSLCLSAITWAGFDNFWFLFSHMDSRDSFAIPHDLKILKEVFLLEPDGYPMENAFWHAHNIRGEIASLGEAGAPLAARVETIITRYTDLSERYQALKNSLDVAFN
jgi:tRNA(Arg) A34 adenosine deaminase TadA